MPVARPERIRNRKDLGSIWEIVPADPTTNTMIQEKISTTTVRTAVATSESVCLIPHFARIAVKPANIDDYTAIRSHIICLLFRKLFSSIIVY